MIIIIITLTTILIIITTIITIIIPVIIITWLAAVCLAATEATLAYRGSSKSWRSYLRETIIRSGLAHTLKGLGFRVTCIPQPFGSQVEYPHVRRSHIVS